MDRKDADLVKPDSLALRGLRPAEIFCAAEAGSQAAVSEAPLSPCSNMKHSFPVFLCNWSSVS